MKRTSQGGVVAVLFAAFFAAAVTASGFADFRRQVRDVRDELRRSDERTAALTEENTLLRARLAHDLVKLDDRSARLEGEMRRGRVDVEGLYREILHPSIQVDVRESVGGGTLLRKENGQAWAVTAFHVVQKAATDDPAETRPAIRVKLYDRHGAVTLRTTAALAVWNRKHDLALLRIEGNLEAVEVARPASRATLESIRVFTPIYAVGCPLAHDPLPTLGEIASLKKEVEGESFWMMSAPTIFGNSGGGVFNRATHEMIGVSVMVCTYDGVVSTPVPHLSVMAPLTHVYDWLDSEGYRFVYDPDLPAPSGVRKGASTVRTAARR